MKEQNNLLFKPVASQQFNIEALSVRRIDNGGNLKALVDVKCGPFTLKSCRVFQKSDKQPWALLPQTEDKQGQWWPVVLCDDKELESLIKAIALDAFEQELK